MHLHIWNKTNRLGGYGHQLVKLSLGYFFKNLQLKEVICEPSSFNKAPNKTLAKAGFTFTGTRVCTPGMICFEQEVNTWVMKRDTFFTSQTAGEQNIAGNMALE
jgi:RimJ/RimL family protein N-acetyltransferase